MLPDNQDIAHLVYKFNKGIINPDELKILTDWYNSHDDELVTITSTKNEMPEQLKSRILAGLLSKVSAEQQTPVRRLPKLRWTAAAAAVLLLGLGTWMALQYQKPGRKPAAAIAGIGPGGNKATLTLGDNRTIELNANQAGILTGEQITYANGMPVENVEPGQNTGAGMLSLHTPRGGTYKITLADGTEVWLNAESTIKYPSQFVSNERVVELEGEAYFHVKPAYGKDGTRVPFKIISKLQQVEVLGTQFNMNAYPEQRIVKTTLVEGKVAVNDHSSRLILMPDQQAVTNSGKTTIKQVNVDHYTAWRDGKFSFDGRSFEETMAEIGRWYDLDIVYENGIPSAELVGDAYRNEKISLVLRLLDVAEINYQLDVARRKLIIKGKK